MLAAYLSHNPIPLGFELISFFDESGGPQKKSQMRTKAIQRLIEASGLDLGFLSTNWTKTQETFQAKQTAAVNAQI